MSRRILSAQGYVQTDIHYEPDGRVIRTHYQDESVCNPILDANAAKRASSVNKKSDVRPLMSVPSTLVEKWRKEWQANFWMDMEWTDFVILKGSMREYAHLRTTDSNLR